MRTAIAFLTGLTIAQALRMSWRSILGWTLSRGD